jgi:hypothetical protein
MNMNMSIKYINMYINIIINVTINFDLKNEHTNMYIYLLYSYLQGVR